MVPGYFAGGNATSVTQADALAWQVDAGAYCRALEIQRDTLQELVRGWVK